MTLSDRDIARILPVKIAAEERLMALPGVTGVDIALKVVDGERTETACILVFVARKGEFAPDDEIPGTIQGIPTDVEEAVFTHAISSVVMPGMDQNRYDPCQGGCCTAPARFNNYYGTLGLLVTDNLTGSKAWLSNYHVLCNDPSWSNPGVDRNVTQPAIAAGGVEANDTIGQVLRGVYGQVDVSWGYDLYVDCAICSTNGRATSPSVIQIGPPKGAANASYNSLVTKYGATTLRTTGLVVSTNLTVKVGSTTFYYQYRIGPPFPGQSGFSQPGDSGAAVFDENFNVIGIVMSGSGTYTTVNPIGQIIEALNISVP